MASTNSNPKSEAIPGQVSTNAAAPNINNEPGKPAEANTTAPPPNIQNSGPDFKQIIADQVNKPPQKIGVEKRIQLRKKTQKELEEMATAREVVDNDDSEDDDVGPLPHTCPSEYSLQELNTTLTALPIVRAFNSAEGKMKKGSVKGERRGSKKGKLNKPSSKKKSTTQQ